MDRTHYRNCFSNLHDAQGLRRLGSESSPLSANQSYHIGNTMVKKIKSVAILVIFLANLMLAARHGFNALNVVALVSAGLVLLLEAIGGAHHE